MHIVNIMLSTGGGGIEQAFVDYTEGLLRRGHEVTAITHPDAWANTPLRIIGIKPVSFRNMGEWDPIAMLRMGFKLKDLAPDAVIAHTGRAFSLTRFILHKSCPLIGVAHNYNKRVRRMKSASAVFATTHDLIRFAKECNVLEDRIYHIPNMVRCDALPLRAPRNIPPVIGSMGRFVKKKGFNVFIDALKILHERGYRFKAILGGEGDEEKRLHAQAETAGLGDILSFPGWIEDKKRFYTYIDIFCLPSLHEPFGIVLLEAFTHGTPVVATDSEGPRDIITPNFDALLVKKESASELAAAIAKLIDEPDTAATLATNAFVKTKTTYSIESVSERIEKALEAITAKQRA